MIIFTMLKEYKGVEFAAKVIGMLDIAGIAKDAVLELTYEEMDPSEVGVNVMLRLLRQKVFDVAAGKLSAKLNIDNEVKKKVFEEGLMKAEELMRNKEE